VVPGIVVLAFVVVPVIVSVIFYWIFKSFFGFIGTIAEFSRIVDGKGYNCVVMIEVNVKG
jgi:ABC-type sugar transport system permease subunit